LLVTLERKASFPSQLVAGQAGVLALVTIGFVLSRAGAGIDLTDEGFYLNWMHTPTEFPAAVTFFGYLYHPVFRLLDGDIASLRRLNLCLTLGLSFWLLRDALRLGEPRQPGSAFSDHAALLALALCGWMVLRYWLPTPSYNWLALQGLLVAMIGAARLFRVRETGSLTSSAILVAGGLIGLGGFLAAFAKPSTGAMLAGLVVIIALPIDRARLIGLTAAALVALALSGVAIWLIDGSVAGFVARVRLALDQMALLDGGQRLLRIIWPSVPRFGQVSGIALVVLGFALASRLSGRAASGLVALAGVLCLAAGLFVARGDLLPWSQRWGDGLLLAAGLLGVMLAVRPFPAMRRQWRLVIAFALMPVVFTTGTGNNFWDFAPLALIFWCALAMVLVGSGPPGLRREMAVAASAVIAALSASIGLAVTMETPYRQATPLRLQQEVTALGPAGAELRLDRGMSSYVGSLRRPLVQAQAMPIIDLTGLNPGTIHLVGGRAVGAAWLISRYQGSEALIRQQLGLVPCATMARSWLLSSEGGDMPFSPAILAENGLDPAATHELVVRAQSPRDGRMHSLLRPMAEPGQLEAACQAKRAAPR
jgi:hypothetical protein